MCSICYKSIPQKQQVFGGEGSGMGGGLVGGVTSSAVGSLHGSGGEMGAARLASGSQVGSDIRFKPYELSRPPSASGSRRRTPTSDQMVCSQFLTRFVITRDPYSHFYSCHLFHCYCSRGLQLLLVEGAPNLHHGLNLDHHPDLRLLLHQWQLAAQTLLLEVLNKATVAMYALDFSHGTIWNGCLQVLKA